MRLSLFIFSRKGSCFYQAAKSEGGEVEREEGEVWKLKVSKLVFFFTFFGMKSIMLLISCKLHCFEN